MSDNSKKLTILIIDDEKLLLKSLSLSLTILEFNVLAESCSIEAVSFYQSNVEKIDWILLDRTMPNQDGIMTLKALKKINDKCRIVMMSGYFSEEDIHELTALGVEAFLDKPFSVKQLVKILKSDI